VHLAIRLALIYLASGRIEEARTAMLEALAANALYGPASRQNTTTGA
jgi:hypothetical protein